MAKSDIENTVLVGKCIAVIDAVNRHDIGINGRVTDETKNMITVTQEGASKRLIKKNITIRVDGSVLKGVAITGTIQERIKKR